VKGVGRLRGCSKQEGHFIVTLDFVKRKILILKSQIVDLYLINQFYFIFIFGSGVLGFWGINPTL